MTDSLVCGAVGAEMHGKTMRCYLPAGHKFVKHYARYEDDGPILEWGEPKELPTIHSCADNPEMCELLDHKPRI